MIETRLHHMIEEGGPNFSNSRPMTLIVTSSLFSHPS